MNHRPRLLLVIAGVLLPAVVGLVGAHIAMLIGGTSSASVGPFRVELASHFGAGETVVHLPPLGELSADTHVAPLRVRATLEEVHVRQLIDEVRGSGFNDVVERVESDLLAAVRPHAIRLLVVGALGALVLAIAVYRARWRPVGVAVLSAALVVGGSELALWQTYRPEAMTAPTFSGSLALAPRLIGPAETALDRIGRFQAELERIVEGAARVYGSIDSRPPGGDEEIRVLHISDVHLSPIGLGFAREVAESFDVHFVIDTGDLTSFGTPAEELILRYMTGFGRPYLFVLGNHDSRTLPRAMARIPNVLVLAGGTKSVNGATVYGVGHPVFTPDREHALDDDQIADVARGAGARILADISRMATPPAVVAVHDDRMAEALAGRVPLVISGHFHRQLARVVEGTLFLRIGSTGGAGANVFTQAGGVPLSAQILYFRPGTPAELVAYDVIEQSPETASLTVERHLVSERMAGEAPAPTSPSPPEQVETDALMPTTSPS